MAAKYFNLFSKNNISERTAASEENDEKILVIEQKLNDFIKLLDETNINSRTSKILEEKMSMAFEQNRVKNVDIAAFKALDNQPDLSRSELLDNLDVLLSQHQLDSSMTKKHSKKEVTKRIVILLIGLVVITLGFSMIIMPAPPYFEMFTVFYFNDHDGVTIMDIISLLIILTGVYLIITNTSKKSFH